MQRHRHTLPDVGGRDDPQNSVPTVDVIGIPVRENERVKTCDAERSQCRDDNAAANIDEVAPIAARFAEHGGVYATHMRDETDRVLDSIDVVQSISLEMPNRHHLPIDLSRLGLENRNEVFVATEEPHGLIKATLER